MSKGVKQSIFILIFLLIGSLIFSGISILQKESILREKENLSMQLSENEKKLLNGEFQIQELQTSLDALKKEKGSLEKEKTEIESKAKSIQKELQELAGEIEFITKEKDKWKKRFDEINAERDELVVKLQEKAEPEIVYKEKIVYKEREPEEKEPGQIVQSLAAPEHQEDKYWAEVLKEKAELQIEVNQLKKELSDNSIEIIGLKQANTDLQIALDNIQRDREEVSRDIKSIKDNYEREISSLKQDLKSVKETKGALINNLSLELARTKNDTRFIKTQNEKISSENKNLRNQLQQLVATKGELEKTVVKLNQDKDEIEKKLEEREGMIHAKIQEIWQIKESLDETFSSTQLISAVDEKKEDSSQGVNLNPIRVVSGEETQEKVASVKRPAGYNGKIISVNEDNNFVIVDIGEDAGITLGETLGVYRDAEHIATLEIIQTRKDISAADVKEMKSKILQGDIVR